MAKGGKAKGKKTYAVAQDRKENQRDPKDIQTEEQQVQAIQIKKPSVDSQARWVKKRGNLHYGYKSAANDELISGYNLKNSVQDKACRNRALSERQKLRNKLISKEHYKVERK